MGYSLCIVAIFLQFSKCSYLSDISSAERERVREILKDRFEGDTRGCQTANLERRWTHCHPQRVRFFWSRGGRNGRLEPLVNDILSLRTSSSGDKNDLDSCFADVQYV